MKLKGRLEVSLERSLGESVGDLLTEPASSDDNIPSRKEWTSSTGGKAAEYQREGQPHLANSGGSRQQDIESIAFHAPSAAAARARVVQQVKEELAIVRPRMYGSDDYLALKKEYPEFICFKVCDQHKELKTKLVAIQEHTQHIRLALEIVAARCQLKYSTIEKNWRTHKPRKRAKQS